MDLQQNTCVSVGSEFVGQLPMQYTVIFHGCKNDNFQMKNCDIFLFFVVAQNRDRGHTLETNEYPQSMF